MTCRNKISVLGLETVLLGKPPTCSRPSNASGKSPFFSISTELAIATASRDIVIIYSHLGDWSNFRLVKVKHKKWLYFSVCEVGKTISLSLMKTTARLCHMAWKACHTTCDTNPARKNVLIITFILCTWQKTRARRSNIEIMSCNVAASVLLYFWFARWALLYRHQRLSDFRTKTAPGFCSSRWPSKHCILRFNSELVFKLWE